MWAIAYPQLVNNYAETEIMDRLEKIKKGLVAVKGQMEQVLLLISLLKA